jgi:hypothetical protein
MCFFIFNHFNVTNILKFYKSKIYFIHSCIWLLAFPTSLKLVLEVLGAWELVGNIPNWELGSILGASTSKKWELGNQFTKRRALN